MFAGVNNALLRRKYSLRWLLSTGTIHIESNE
jgi:hypothetical protein